MADFDTYLGSVAALRQLWAFDFSLRSCGKYSVINTLGPARARDSEVYNKPDRVQRFFKRHIR